MRLTQEKKLAILKRARALLAKPKGWTQGSYQISSGNISSGNQRTRYAYCVIGAIREAAGEVTTGYIDAHEAIQIAQKLSLETAVKEQGASSVIGWNDDPKRKKRDVLALFDAKIAELESA